MSTSVSNAGSLAFNGQTESEEAVEPLTTLSYKTVGIVEKLKPDQRKSPEVTTQYLLFDFLTKIPKSWVS